MSELADIFRQHGPAYRQKFAKQLLPSQRQAMQAIEQCRTEALGGHVYHCDQCDQSLYSYHSCQNRHCPKCQNEAAARWLARQQALLLPVPHFMVTFTLPAALRPVARRHQKLIYNLLFRTSAAALQQLAQDPRFVGGQIGMVGVLHTWRRDLGYHPHVHYLVPGGALAPDGQSWMPSRANFLVHVKPLGQLFRAKFRAALQQTALYEQVPASVWQQDWVVHSRTGDQTQQALKYLAPYIFRVAISNKRIVKLVDGQVTFSYKAADTGQTKYCTLSAEKFIQRFLEHVLPKGFMKVRYYGYFSPGNRPLLHQVRRLLAATEPAQPTDAQPTELALQERTLPCPQCGQPMRLVETVRPARYRPP